MSDIRFYHLTALPLERVLPVMLERTLERGGKALIRGRDPERLADLDRELWTYDDAAFLPHGLEGDGTDPARQPVWLTHGPEVPEGADTLFLVDGARVDPAEGARFALTALLFDAADPAALEAARDDWRAVKAAGLTAVYWAQEGGRWVKKAEARPAG